MTEKQKEMKRLLDLLEQPKEVVKRVLREENAEVDKRRKDDNN